MQHIIQPTLNSYTAHANFAYGKVVFTQFQRKKENIYDGNKLCCPPDDLPDTDRVDMEDRPEAHRVGHGTQVLLMTSLKLWVVRRLMRPAGCILA